MFCLRKLKILLQHCSVAAVELYFTHFWLRYAMQLSQLTSILLLTAVTSRFHFRQLSLCRL